MALQYANLSVQILIAVGLWLQLALLIWQIKRGPCSSSWREVERSIANTARRFIPPRLRRRPSAPASGVIEDEAPAA